MEAHFINTLGLKQYRPVFSGWPRHKDFRWWEGAPRWNAGALPFNQRRMLSHPQRSPRRATLSPSRTRCLGMDGHKETMAVASGAQDHGAEGTSLGSLGPRQWAMDPRLRKRQSKAPQLRFVAATRLGWRGRGPL